MDTRYAQERFARLRRLIGAADLDAVLVFKPQNTFYCSYFMPGIYSHPVAVLVPVDGEPALVIWANRGPSARESSAVGDIVTYGRWAKEVGHPDWVAAVTAAMTERGLSGATIGIEGEYLPASYLERLRTATPGVRYTDLGDVLTQARMVKDPAELSAMRDACTLTDVGVAAAQEAAGKRGTEIEISQAAMFAMHEHWREHLPHREAFDFGHSEGGVYNSLWCYTLAGDRVRMNCAQPTSRRVEEGELVWSVVTAALDGQHAENERTFAIGRLDDVRRDAYEALLRIHAEGQALCRPGVRLGAFHEDMLELYRAHGYGDFPPGRIGHGIGLGAHEQPSMGPSDDTVLEPGMTITYEPNLRIPAFGGLQHSDTVLVTEGGFEFLTRHRRDLITV